MDGKELYFSGEDQDELVRMLERAYDGRVIRAEFETTSGHLVVVRGPEYCALGATASVTPREVSS